MQSGSFAQCAASTREQTLAHEAPPPPESEPQPFMAESRPIVKVTLAIRRIEFTRRF